jgi:hypothetical protein
MPYRRNYPRTVAEILDATLSFKPDALRALKAFRRAKPWRGTPAERQAKFVSLHFFLCDIYQVNPKLEIGAITDCYSPASNTVYLTSRMSVVSYLHEFGHARGWSERQTVRWSVNLFRRIFPRQFARLSHEGHMLRRREDTGASGQMAITFPNGSTLVLDGVRVQVRRRRRRVRPECPDDTGQGS